MFDSLCRFKILETENLEYKPIFSVYSSKDVKFHVTREDRVEELLKSNFFTILSVEEKKRFFKNKFITHIIEINENEDIAIAGLGWINVKRGPLKIEITLPEGVKATIRPSIFKKKK